MIIFEEVNLTRTHTYTKDELVYQNLECNETSSSILFLFLLSFLIELLRNSEIDEE